MARKKSLKLDESTAIWAQQEVQEVCPDADVWIENRNELAGDDEEGRYYIVVVDDMIDNETIDYLETGWDVDRFLEKKREIVERDNE
jgi:hypothetical protein